MSVSSASSNSASRSTRINLNVVLFFIVGLISLLFAEQVATGWLTLGDHINISRRDLNFQELAVIVVGTVWGLLALWTAAVSFTQVEDNTQIRRFFDGEGRMPAGLIFSTGVLAVIGLLCLFIAEQILTGWLPLGNRANISRRDLNIIEWATIVGTLIWAALCLRTVVGFIRRERPAWSWGQWALFIIALVSAIVLAYGSFHFQSSLPDNASLGSNLSLLVEMVAPGLLMLGSSLVAYRYVASEYGLPTAQKTITGSLSERARARDISATHIPAGQTLRNQLAKSPGAGAIVGFIALFLFFSVATDLFLSPDSLASALTNNVTRGIVAIGATMLMISGEFDLSVGSIVGIAGLSFLGLMTGQFPPGGPQLDPLVAGVLTIIFATLLGAMNGAIMIYTGIPSFIVTLATQLMLRGIPLVFIAGGKNLRYVDYFADPPYIYINRLVLIVLTVVAVGILAFLGRSLILSRYRAFRARLANYQSDTGDFRTLSLEVSLIYLLIVAAICIILVVILVGIILDQFNLIGQGSTMLQVSFFDLANGRIESLPFIGAIAREINLRMGVFWWMVLVVIFQFVLNQTRYGNATFAVGGNPGAALAQGINVRRMKILSFMLVGALSGIAGILDASRLQSIDALRGSGLELEVIAATVIGGALLSGGYGSIIGALLGVFIFGMMQTGLVLIRVDARLFNAFIGLIILLAVIINNWSRRIRT